MTNNDKVEGETMKKLVCILMILVLCGCSISQKINNEEQSNIINKEGTTILTRINTPNDYTRVEIEKNSFGYFVRNYSLKEYGSPILLYNGQKKLNQNNQVSVFKLPLENEDLQQCADSVIRMYAEYYYSTKQYDKIAFQFVDGFVAKYTKWKEGYRIKFDNNEKPYYKKMTSEDSSYDCFKKYLRIVFAYASTLSLYNESKSIELSNIQIGDIFIKAGSPGHVVMVVDVCENKEGKKAFLLAQGYMPAQEFHIIKNPRHDDPWYYEEEVTYPFQTADYTFSENSLRRLNY
jgi:hypothetical protein